MTEEQLKAIEARCEAATPGPWTLDDHSEEATITCNTADIATMFRWEHYRADAAFIAHAREDIPALVTALREKNSDGEEMVSAVMALRQDFEDLKGSLHESKASPEIGAMTEEQLCKLANRAEVIDELPEPASLYQKDVTALIAEVWRLRAEIERGDPEARRWANLNAAAGEEVSDA